MHTETGVAGELIAGTHPDGEHHHVGALERAVLKLQRGDRARLVRIESRRADARAHRDVSFSEDALHHG